MDSREEFVKMIENRIKILDEGESRIVKLSLMNIEHKRNFLGNIMSISIAAIAGLFILLSQSSYFEISEKLVLINVILLGLFIILSAVYLTSILSQESVLLDENIQFTKRTRAEFIESVKNGTVHDIESYEEYRKLKYSEEINSRKSVKGSNEIWFILLNFFIYIFFCVIIVIFFL